MIRKESQEHRPCARLDHKPRTKASKKIALADTRGQERLSTLRKTNVAGQTNTDAPGNYQALQRLDAAALCASALVAQEEAPCYCGDAADDCFEHPDVIRELTKYVDEDDDDDEDEVEAIAPAPRQAPPAGWGKLLSALRLQT